MGHLGVQSNGRRIYAEELGRTIETRAGCGARQIAHPVLILITDRLGVRFSVRVEKFLSALLPCRLEFGRGDVPVRSAFLRHSAQVLPQFFHRGAAEEPIAVVDLIDDKTWL